MNCGVLTDSKTTVKKLQIAGRLPLGSGHELEVDIVEQATQKRVGQVGYHASRVCHTKFKLDILNERGEKRRTRNIQEAADHIELPATKTPAPQTYN